MSVAASLESELGAYVGKDEAPQCIVGTREGVAVARAGVRRDRGAIRIAPTAAGDDDRGIHVGNVVAANLQAHTLVEIQHRGHIDVVVRWNVSRWREGIARQGCVTVKQFRLRRADVAPAHDQIEAIPWGGPRRVEDMTPARVRGATGYAEVAFSVVV